MEYDVPGWSMKQLVGVLILFLGRSSLPSFNLWGIQLMHCRVRQCGQEEWKAEGHNVTGMFSHNMRDITAHNLINH